MAITNKNLQRIEHEDAYRKEFKAQRKDLVARANAREDKHVKARSKDPWKTFWQCVTNCAHAWAIERRNVNKFFDREDEPEITGILNANRR